MRRGYRKFIAIEELATRTKEKFVYFMVDMIFRVLLDSCWALSGVIGLFLKWHSLKPQYFNPNLPKSSSHIGLFVYLWNAVRLQKVCCVRITWFLTVFYQTSCKFISNNWYSCLFAMSYIIYPWLEWIFLGLDIKFNWKILIVVV